MRLPGASPSSAIRSSPVTSGAGATPFASRAQYSDSSTLTAEIRLSTALAGHLAVRRNVIGQCEQQHIHTRLAVSRKKRYAAGV